MGNSGPDSGSPRATGGMAPLTLESRRRGSGEPRRHPRQGGVDSSGDIRQQAGVLPTTGHGLESAGNSPEPGLVKF